MRIINVIAHDNQTGILSIESFGVFEEQLESDVVADAEDCFARTCVKHKYGVLIEEDDIQEIEDYKEYLLDEAIEDGYENIGNTTVSFVWSDI